MTCSTCGRRCSSWWELLHGHDCEPALEAEASDITVDEADYDDEQEQAYGRWKDNR